MRPCPRLTRGMRGGRLVRVSLALATWIGLAAVSAASPQSAAAAPGDALRFGEVPDFALTDQRGRSVRREDLVGAPWIANLFFTSCAGPCPRLTADIRRFLHDALEGSPIRLVSISVDPEFDTPGRLADYAERFRADPERWLFLTGSEDAVHRFAMEGLALGVAKPSAEEVPPAERLAERLQVTHSTKLVVVDPEGRIAGYYSAGGEEGLSEGETEEGFVAALARARSLAGLRPRSPLPAVNAGLNASAFVLLVAGLVAIRRGDRSLHAKLMLAAFVTSAAFLACYLYYHFAVVPLAGGPTRYHGQGWRRTGYLVLLGTHTAGAVLNLPMVLRTLWLAYRREWVRHRRSARVTWPLWAFVSVTGVAVYLVLYHGNPAPTSP